MPATMSSAAASTTTRAARAVVASLRPASCTPTSISTSRCCSSASAGPSATSPAAPPTSPTLLRARAIHPQQLVQPCSRLALYSAAPSAAAGVASTSDAKTEGELAYDRAREFAVAVATVLDDTKCQDILVLDVSPLVSWTSFMIFGSVASKPQLLAALARVEKMAQEQYDRQQQNTPGNSPWECLDFGDCVLHVMSAEQRQFYDLESFYATAEEVELPFDVEKPAEEQGGPRWTREQPPVV